MGGRVRKCVICGEVFLPTDTIVPYKDRYAHEKCFETAVKLIGTHKQAQLAERARQRKAQPKTNRSKKPKEVIKQGVNEEDFATKKAYYDYLKFLTQEQTVNVKQIALSEQYVDRYKFTFEGMYQTLRYLNEILHKELEGDIVGLIPYYYDESKRFSEELDHIKEQNRNINWSDLYTVRKVFTTPSKPQHKEIDITQIKEQ